MNPKTPAVSVVVVNYNGKEFLAPCLESIPAGVETVFVDNGSTDGSVAYVTSTFPSFLLHRNPGNYGFARAVNQGLDLAKGRYVCLLNTDARLQPDTLTILKEYMDAHPDVGMTTAQLFRENGKKRHSFAEDPSLASAFVNKSLLRLVAPGRFPSKNQEHAEPAEVDTLIGACLMVRRALIDQIGPLDEGYFLFFEETDWCLRARRAGWKLVLVPAAKAVHILGLTRQKVRVRARIESARSQFRYFRRNLPGSYPFLRLFYPIRSLVEFLFQSLGVFLPKVRRRWQETAAVLGWQICGAPRSWGLSMAIEPKVMTLRDGTRVLEEHAEAFNDFDGKRRTAKTIKDLTWKRTQLYSAVGRTYYVKIYKVPGWGKRIKNFLLGSRAAREWEMSRGVHVRGIPQAPVIALRESMDETWIAVEKLDDWAQLQETLLGLADRRRLCREYGRFARRLHESGIWQYDFNPTNVLVRDGRFRLIDFERMELTEKAVSRDRRLRSLAKMNRIPALSRTDRLRFLRGYIDADAAERSDWKPLARTILSMHVEQMEHDVDRSERRCLDENRDFGAFEAGDWRGHYLKKRPDRAGGLTIDEVKILAGGNGEAYRIETASDALVEWQKANRRAKEGGPAPVAVLLKRSSSEGKIAFPRAETAPKA
ncbi:MAG TPA: glycosyltransferase [Planctomycetota bacterium]|nr:glycosyltransferase [Planctomycetota bacterium]